MKPRVIFIGALPPPYMGPTLATEVILASSIREEFELIHLDTSDHREIDTLGAFDFTNIWLAVRSYFVLTWLILRHWPRMVYVPISQTTIGYLKDSGYILIAKVLGRRVLCHLRGGNFANWMAGASGLTRLYVRAVHGLVDGQIVLGECLRKLFAGFVAPARIHVVSNGKNCDYRAAPRHNARQQLLYLGNMVRTKGVMDVLHATPAIARACPGADFVFAGSWEDPVLRQEIEEFIAAHPELPIRWLGTVSGQRKKDALEQADVFAFPTYYPPEGHPWVVVEAMAAGLPIISTDQGAITESVLDGVNGYVIAKQSPEAVAEHAIRLLQDPELRRVMGQKSRQRYESHFTEAAMVAQLARAFRAITG
jgi:glycosyltransferase involved in cell wall biosynthesis